MLARKLTQLGQPVHLVARGERRLKDLAAELGAGHTVCDLMEPEQVAAAVDAAAVDGRLAGLAIAIGSIDLKPFQRTQPDDFMRAFALNVAAAATVIDWHSARWPKAAAPSCCSRRWRSSRPCPAIRSSRQPRAASRD